MLRPTVSRPASLGVKHPSGAQDHIITVRQLAGLLMWGVHSDERTGLVYNCCWHSSAQSFSGPSPAGLMTIFCCFRLETPQPGGPGPRIYSYISQEQSGPDISPGTGFPFSRLQRLCRVTVKVFEPASTRCHTLSLCYSLLMTSRHGPHRKQLFCCCVRVCCCGNVFTKPLPGNGRGISAYLAVVA
jgi:hypothetical protein